jgi:hypothetical protein
MRQADRSREVARPNYPVGCPMRAAVADPMPAVWEFGEGLDRRAVRPNPVADRPTLAAVALAIRFAAEVWSAGDSLPAG